MTVARIRRPNQAAQRLENSTWFDRAVRVGLGAYGVVHLLIGWLALQLVFTGSQPTASQQGALNTLARQPFGAVLLWVVALGFLALAVWQGFMAVWGHSSDDGGTRALKRVGSAARAIVYLVLGLSAAETAIGQSSSTSKSAMTARLLALPGGQLIVAVIGLTVVGVGVFHGYTGVSGRFKKKLADEPDSNHAGQVLHRVAQVGYVAKGIALTVVGALFVWAAATYSPKKAGGLDVALQTMLQQPFGPWLLTVVAVGIICFGLWCFGWARYADTTSS